jgi:NNP family nitrate/nitrite transporter-like MFS transporter
VAAAWGDTTVTETVPSTTPEAPVTRDRWLHDWRPNDVTFWTGGGNAIARRNLILSIFSEHIGCSIWSLWSVFVLFMGPKYGFDPSQKFALTAVPTAVGALIRIPYSFAVTRFGGRNWTVFAALLLLIPSITAAIVLKPGISFGTALLVAALAGVGGGNFASSMTNINLFYPERLKGWALGLNAGGGNLGVPAVQLVGLLVLATAGAAHPRLILAVYLPLIVVAALGAWLFMDNIAGVRSDKKAMQDVTREPHTWVISLLYIGTFGSFIGFGFAFGLVLINQFKGDFPTPVDAAYLTFLGPLLGSLIRPVGGRLADRFGGATITFWNFVAMAASASLVLVASLQKSLPVFIIGFVLLFVFSGIGNGSTYTMIPAIFASRSAAAQVNGTPAAEAERNARRLSGALIGLAGAIGAFGGVLVNLAFRQSFMDTGSGDRAYIAFIAFYAICFAVTWFAYLRPGSSRLTNG